MQRKEMRAKSCCFTGHRIIRSSDRDTLSERLKDEIRKLYADGIVNFICGGALGFDMLAGETVIELRDELEDITLELMLPCKNQDEKWNSREKLRYAELLKRADKISYISEAYSSVCMYVRNHKMVESSIHCIAYLYKNFGGAALTVRYANEADIGLTIL